MSSQQKRGFRLPWAADRSADEASGTTTLEADSDGSTTPAQIEDGVGGDLGEGPFHFADAATPNASTDASPEAPDVPETAAEAAMLNTESATTESAAADAEAAPTTTDDGWPTVSQAEDAETASEQDTFQAVMPDATDSDAATTEQAAPKASSKRSAHVEPDPRATRSNPLVAGLVKAMREAAIASRAETTTRLQAEATARVEEIRTGATEESATLRKRVDEDIASIRDWSKGEVARIRQETEERIEARRAEAIEENDRHTAHVEKVVEQVQGRVDAYEADMDRFFERLLAENDPARLAALAEQAPDAPDLTYEEPEIVEAPVAQVPSEWDDVAWGAPVPTDEQLAEARAAIETEASTEAEAPIEAEASVDADAPVDAEAPVETEAVLEPETPVDAEAALEPEAAAEAEAASTEGLELPSDNVWPSSVLAAARRTLHTPATDFEAAGIANTRLFVNGLTSVAGISAFKGALGQLTGVRSVSVSSGEPGVFIFTVVHSPETDLQDGIAGLTSFSARVTEALDDRLTVVAQEPAA